MKWNSIWNHTCHQQNLNCPFAIYLLLYFLSWGHRIFTISFLSLYLNTTYFNGRIRKSLTLKCKYLTMSKSSLPRVICMLQTLEAILKELIFRSSNRYGMYRKWIYFREGAFPYCWHYNMNSRPCGVSGKRKALYTYLYIMYFIIFWFTFLELFRDTYY